MNWVEASVCSLALCSAAIGGASVSAAQAGGGVLGRMMGDWNGDFMPDQAELIAVDGQADLRLTLSDGVGRSREIMARGIVWRGAMAGTEAALFPSDAGGLVVVSQNSSIGRYRWEERLTLAYRDGAMRVAGVTRSTFDTIGRKKNDCDLNMLTGEGTVNGVPVVIPVFALPVERWSADDSTPELCLELE